MTRFYTALGIYSILARISEFDNALREAFEKGAHAGVVFIRKDSSNRIIPCSPNKISVSSITTLKPGTRMLPIGFQTGYVKDIRNTIERIDRSIADKTPDKTGNPFIMELPAVNSIVDMIAETLEMEFDWDWGAFKSCMEYFSRNTANKGRQGKIWCLVRTGRELSRKKDDGSFSDAPDTGKTDTEPARQVAADIPALILIRQNGSAEIGWRGHPFWWPILVAPKRTPTVIFAN